MPNINALVLQNWRCPQCGNGSDACICARRGRPYNYYSHVKAWRNPEQCANCGAQCNRGELCPACTSRSQVVARFKRHAG